MSRKSTVSKIRTSAFLSHSLSRKRTFSPTGKFMKKCTVNIDLLYYEVLSSYDMAYVVT